MEDKAPYETDAPDIEGRWVKESPIDLSKLKDVFPPEDIEWRVQSSGEKDGKPWALVLAYITNRAIMDRFDEVCGPENWKNEFIAAPNGGTLCGLSIKINGEWVTKWDGAENTDIEAVKGGLSGAMKRAAVHWGPGRYLYNLPTGWAVVSNSGSHRDKTKQGTWFKWNPPPLPAWAVPSGTKQQKPPEKHQDAPQAPEEDVPDFSPPEQVEPTETTISSLQVKAMIGTMKSNNVPAEEFCEKYGLKAVSELPAAKNGEALQWLLLEGKNRKRGD